jgi:hypothetical protein
MRASKMVYFYVCAEAEWAGALFARYLRHGKPYPIAPAARGRENLREKEPALARINAGSQEDTVMTGATSRLDRLAAHPALEGGKL